MTTFRPKPSLLIDAYQWTGQGRDAPRLPPWVMAANPLSLGSHLEITTANGRVRVDPTDYLARVSSGILVLKRDEFEAIFISTLTL